MTVVALLCGAGTLARNEEYRSSLRLAETTFERWPTPAAHSMLGTELAAAGRFPERSAIFVKPPRSIRRLATTSGRCWRIQGRHAEAIDQLRSFIDSQPPELDQVQIARALLARSLMKQERIEEAGVQYRTMIAADPDDLQAVVQLAQIHLRQQRFEEAIPLFRKVLAARPADPSTLGGLGIALASTGQLDEAIEVFRRALDLDPENQHAQQNLERALSLKRTRR